MWDCSIPEWNEMKLSYAVWWEVNNLPGAIMWSVTAGSQGVTSRFSGCRRRRVTPSFPFRVTVDTEASMSAHAQCWGPWARFSKNLMMSLRKIYEKVLTDEELRMSMWLSKKSYKNPMNNLGRRYAKLMKNLRRHYRYLTKTWNSRQVTSFGKPPVRGCYWSNTLS